MSDMGKLYVGNLPSVENGWRKLGVCIDNNVEWLIFSKPQHHSIDWRTYKIVANGKALNKANYWMVRNNATGQLGFIRDYAHMRTTRPELHAKVEQMIEGKF